jgi:hypothetical protein
MRRLSLVLLMVCVIGLLGCGSDGGDDGGGGGGGGGAPTDVASICNKIFDCLEDQNFWGWDTQENCEASFLQDCESESGYLGCTATCVAGACTAWDPCEPNCWTKHCE